MGCTMIRTLGPVEQRITAESRDQARRAARRKQDGSLGDRIAIGLMKGTVFAVVIGLACAVPVTAIPVVLLVLIYFSMRR